MAMHERNKNIGVENKVFCNSNCLKEGIDLKQCKKDYKRYLNEKFNYKQMHEIRIGLKRNLNISKYAYPSFNADQMYEIRLSLTYSLSLSLLS